MINSTLCYLNHEDKVLLLYRNKKPEDMNEGKWLGIGGKFEEKESPEEACRREILEETGLTAQDLRLRGIITFVSDQYPTEHMFLFDGTTEKTEVIPCDEGELHWIERDRMLDLPMWEGDRLFLQRLYRGEPFFTMKLRYEGDDLVEAQCNGRKI